MQVLSAKLANISAGVPEKFEAFHLLYFGRSQSAADSAEVAEVQVVLWNIITPT